MRRASGAHRPISSRQRLLLAILHQVAKVRTTTAEQRYFWVHNGLPRSSPPNPHPHPRRERLRDIEEDTDSGSVSAEETGGVRVDKKDMPDTAGNGADHGTMEEVNREAGQLEPNGDDGRVGGGREV